MSGYNLEPHAVRATARLLELYDSQLEAAPLDNLIEAHERAQVNFQANPLSFSDSQHGITNQKGLPGTDR